MVGAVGREDAPVRWGAVVCCGGVAGVCRMGLGGWGVGGFDPFEQLMLFLSWGALGYTSANMILTSKVADDTEDP